MNTGQTEEVHREDISNLILESLMSIGDRIWNPDIAVALPFPGDYQISLGMQAFSASVVIIKGAFHLSVGYFSSEYDDDDEAWGCAEQHYLRLTGKSALEWSLPARPDHGPFLAVIRLQGDLRCDCQVCKEKRQREPSAPLEQTWTWVGDVESALAYLALEESRRMNSEVERMIGEGAA